MIPEECILAGAPIAANEGRRTLELLVANIGDIPIQVGSHFHFFEVDRALRFNWEAAFGTRLAIPADTAVRLEPGDDKAVTLVELGGQKEVHGFNSPTNGPTDESSGGGNLAPTYR